MAKQLQQRRIGTVAFALAVLMALQALFGTFALAAAAAPSSVDAFGNPLCITHMAEQQQAPIQGPIPGKDGVPGHDCCTLACAAAVNFVPTGRAAAILFNPLAQPSQRMLEGYAAPAVRAHDDLPGHPRGPPATV
jgi:hypothetical protein